jgi:hypothetical protein
MLMSNLIRIRPVILGVIHVNVRKDGRDNAIAIFVCCVEKKDCIISVKQRVSSGNYVNAVPPLQKCSQLVAWKWNATLSNTITIETNSFALIPSPNSPVLSNLSFY